MRIDNWKKFNETVYLKNTLLNSYSAVSYNGILNVTLDVKNKGKVYVDIETYGEPKDKEFILHLNDNIGKEEFSEIVSSFMYVLNKNKLGYEFNIDTYDKESSGRTYVIFKSNKQCKIEDIERVIQTTKITNSKIKDIGDFDKLVYQTIKEGHSKQNYYHFTDIGSFLNILKQDTLRGGNTNICLTRDKNLHKHNDYIGTDVRIELSDSLLYNYKIKPYQDQSIISDVDGTKIETSWKGDIKRDYDTVEFEERLCVKNDRIDNIKKYIENVTLMVWGGDINKLYHNKDYYLEVIKLLNEKEIPYLIYNKNR